MRIVSYNIHKGGIGRADPLAEILLAQNADVIGLTEANDPVVLERLSRRLKMACLVACGNGQTCAILSRRPIRDSVNYAATGRLPGALLVANIQNIDGQSLTVAVGDQIPKDLLSGSRPHLMLGLQIESPDGYVNVLSQVSVTVQQPVRKTSTIYSMRIEAKRFQSAWIEQDRLAQFASESYPSGCEVL